MKKTKVYLDMDGTIADLYAQPNWLERLYAEDHTVFLNARAVITEEQLLKEYPLDKYDIRILSMTPLGATDDYCNLVKYAKNKWLDEHFPSLTNRIYMKYGHNKNLAYNQNAILIDDSEPVRKTWRGLAIMPTWGAALSV